MTTSDLDTPRRGHSKKTARSLGVAGKGANHHRSVHRPPRVEPLMSRILANGGTGERIADGISQFVVSRPSDIRMPTKSSPSRCSRPLRYSERIGSMSAQTSERRQSRSSTATPSSTRAGQRCVPRSQMSAQLLRGGTSTFPGSSPAGGASQEESRRSPSCPALSPPERLTQPSFDHRAA